MKHAFALTIVAASLAGPANAGTVAGAQDGGYRSQDDDFLLIQSKDNLVGVQGLDCKSPVVSRGRLRAKNCWANGHLGGDVDVSWRVDGNVIVSEGKRYVFMPPLPPPAPKGKVDPFDPSPDSWMHNQSSVRVDPKTGRITYLWAKPQMRSVVKPGTLLYEGDLKPGSLMLGKAYAFKPGCPPVSYPVRGVYSEHNERLTFTGPGPMRKGCEVTAYSYDSPHSKLVFEYVVGD